MEHADFVIAASQIANALGLFTTQAQVTTISHIIKKSVHRDLVLNPETNPESCAFIGSETYTNQRKYLQETLNVSVQWENLQTLSRECEFQEDLRELEQQAFQLLFFNRPVEQEVAHVIAYYESYAPVHKAAVLQLVHTLLETPESVWANVTALETYKTAHRLDNLHDLLEMLTMSASLYRYVTSQASRCYGTRGEGKTISARNGLCPDKKYHIKQTNKTYFKKTGLLTPIKQYEWAILGKIDGLANGVLFEIKHRKNTFFYPLPLYELIQIHAYMFLTDKSSCSLMQCARRRRAGVYSETAKIYFDADFWNDVLRCLKHLMAFIETLVSVPIAGEAFFRLPLCEKQKLLSKHVPRPRRVD